MMKAIALLSILILTACGKYDVGTGETFKDKSLNPVKLGSGDSQRIRQICDALSEKERTITSLSGTDYTFSGTSKGCDETEAKPLSDTAVVLEIQNAPKFMVGANQFYFGEVETTQSGLMAKICSALSSGELESPIIDGQNVIYFTTNSVNANDCPTVAREHCVQVEKGVKVNTEEGERARIHTREWARFKLEQPLIGFFSYRKISTVAGCQEGRSLERTATLKLP